MINYKKSIAAVSLLALTLGAPSVLASEKTFDAGKPQVLEFNYDEGETSRYSLDYRMRSKIKESWDAKFNMMGETCVMQESEGMSRLSMLIEEINGKISRNGRINQFDTKTMQQNEIFRNFPAQEDISLFIYRNGIVEYVDEETGNSLTIDFFPDEAIKAGDKWKSKAEFLTTGVYSFDDKTEEFNLDMELAGSIKYKEEDMLVIHFLGRQKNGDFLQGNMVYDPGRKKIAQFSANLHKKGIDTTVGLSLESIN